MTTSALPERSWSKACPMLSVDDAQADTIVCTAARAENSIPTAAAGPLGMSMGTVSGMTRREPSSRSVSQALSRVQAPPIPVPQDTASRSGSTSGAPASCHASRAEIRAKRLLGSRRLASTRVRFSSTTEASMGAAKSTGMPYFSDQSLVRVRAPDVPARAARQVASAPVPRGVTAPSPVTTTVEVMV